MNRDAIEEFIARCAISSRAEVCRAGEIVRQLLEENEEAYARRPLAANAIIDRVASSLLRWKQATGHDRCWYMPEIMYHIAEVIGVRLTKVDGQPCDVSRAEFREGCMRYEAELYGDEPCGTIGSMKASAVDRGIEARGACCPACVEPLTKLVEELGDVMCGMIICPFCKRDIHVTVYMVPKYELVINKVPT